MENGFDSFFLFILFKKFERLVGGIEGVPDSLKLPVLHPQQDRKKVSGDSSPTQTKLRRHDPRIPTDGPSVCPLWAMARRLGGAALTLP